MSTTISEKAPGGLGGTWWCGRKRTWCLCASKQLSVNYIIGEGHSEAGHQACVQKNVVMEPPFWRPLLQHLRLRLWPGWGLPLPSTRAWPGSPRAWTSSLRRKAAQALQKLDALLLSRGRPMCRNCVPWTLCSRSLRPMGALEPWPRKGEELSGSHRVEEVSF